MALTVGTRELKNRLTKYLRMVRAGTRLVVTDRGTPVAEVSPLGRTVEVEPFEAWLAQLAGSGRVRLPDAGALGSFKPERIKGRPVSETIVEDRR